jgi:hypothetical protein
MAREMACPGFKTASEQEKMAITIESMTIRERLHKLVDELTEAEAERALSLVEKEHEDP